MDTSKRDVSKSYQMSYKDSFELREDARLYAAKSAEIKELIETIKDDDKARELIKAEYLLILEKHLAILEEIVRIRGLKKDKK